MKDQSDEASLSKVIGRASVVAAGTTYQQGISLVSGLLIARVIGAADYGIFVLARSLLDIAGIVTRLGLDIGLQRYFGEKNGKTTQEKTAVLRRLRMVAASIALIPLIALALGFGHFIEQHIYPHEGFGYALLCLAIALPFLTDIAVMGGAYRGILKLTPSVLTECVLLPTARLVVAVALFVIGWRLWGVLAGTTLAALIAWVFLARRAHTDFSLAARGPVGPGPEAIKVVKYSCVLAMAALVTTLTNTIDTLTLGRHVSAQELGQYSLVKMLVIQMGVGGVAIAQGLGALVAERHSRGDFAGVAQVLSRNARWIALVTLPIYGMFLFWGSSVTLVFGSSYAISQTIVSWLATGQFVFLIFAPSGWALSMTGRHVLELKILSLGFALSAALCWFAVPVYGQMGAAVAVCTSIIFVNAARVLVIRSAIGALPFRSDVFFITAMGVLLAWISKSAVAYLPLNVLWSTLTGITCFVLLYMVVAWTQLLSVEEKDSLRSMLARRARVIFRRENQAA